MQNTDVMTKLCKAETDGLKPEDLAVLARTPQGILIWLILARNYNKSGCLNLWAEIAADVLIAMECDSKFRDDAIGSFSLLFSAYPENDVLQVADEILDGNIELSEEIQTAMGEYDYNLAYVVLLIMDNHITEEHQEILCQASQKANWITPIFHHCTNGFAETAKAVGEQRTVVQSIN